MPPIDLYKQLQAQYHSDDPHISRYPQVIQDVNAFKAHNPEAHAMGHCTGATEGCLKRVAESQRSPIVLPSTPHSPPFSPGNPYGDPYDPRIDDFGKKTADPFAEPFLTNRTIRVIPPCKLYYGENNECMLTLCAYDVNQSDIGDKSDVMVKLWINDANYTLYRTKTKKLSDFEMVYTEKRGYRLIEYTPIYRPIKENPYGHSQKFRIWIIGQCSSCCTGDPQVKRRPVFMYDHYFDFEKNPIIDLNQYSHITPVECSGCDGPWNFPGDLPWD